jgi:hypothetical protein
MKEIRSLERTLAADGSEELAEVQGRYEAAVSQSLKAAADVVKLLERLAQKRLECKYALLSRELSELSWWYHGTGAVIDKRRDILSVRQKEAEDALKVARASLKVIYAPGYVLLSNKGVLCHLRNTTPHFDLPAEIETTRSAGAPRQKRAYRN